MNIGKRQIYKNILMNLISFAVQFIIGFYISPIIVKKAGAAAYGFIGVANDFVSYASILATIFNSVASRFIAKEYYSKDYQKANNYFNSLLLANVLLSAFFGFLSIFLVPILDTILSIPIELVWDVKITFALIFASYIVSLVTSVFTVSTFITNRTDIQGIRNIINYVVRLALIIIFLNFVSIHIYWIAAATLLASVVVALMNIRLTKVLTPKLSIAMHYARSKYALQLAQSGGWMALTSISVILMRGLDLTVANVMLGDYEMGILSIARTMPNNFTSAVAILAPLFTPIFISLYTVNHRTELAENVKQSIYIMAIVMFVPISGFIVYSKDFYSLWQRSLSNQEIVVVAWLSNLTLVLTYFDTVTATMAQISVVANRLRIPVFVSLGCGGLSFILEIILIRETKLGLYAIIVSTLIIMVIRYIFFNPLYAAYCLGESRTYFYSTLFRTCCIIPVLLIVMLFVRYILPVDSWISLCRNGVLCGVSGYFIMILCFRRNLRG